MASQQGNKYYIAGDADGKISVFTKNGTFRTKIDATNEPGVPVDSIDSYMSSLLFRAGGDWGFVELERMQVRHVDCPRFEGKVAAAVIDSQQSSRVLVADEEGAISVLNVKNKKECKLEMKFNKGATR